VGGGRIQGKGIGGETCTHVSKWKMRPIETIPGMGKGG
jgi:hypothetical protein